LIGEPGPEAPLGTYLCHAYCELGATPLVQALRDIDAFLAGHPDEVVMLFLQDQIAPEDTAKAFIASGLVKRVYTHEPGVPVPTLGAMIESGERVVVFADKDASGVDWYLQGSTFFQETPFAVDSVAQLSCVAGRGDPRNPLFALNHWIGGPFPSTDIARQINAFEFLLGRAKQCAEQRGAMVNVVALNFVEIGDGLRVVDALNGVSHKGEDGN
jgi:hypothetical protein